MSFTENKREHIKRYILEKIGDHQRNIANKTSEVFQISLNTVYRYIRELEEEHIIQKMNGRYELKKNRHSVILERSKGEVREEDLIYETYVKEYMEKLPDNVKVIWEYSFMEMMNNAIDHSEAQRVNLSISQDYMNTTIMILDDGIGIFQKIKEYYDYETLDDAVNELFKGKLTTDRKNHSGEGIFFTSRVLDRFAAVSDGKIFTHDKYTEQQRNLEDIPNLSDWKNRKGTIIYMRLSNFSNKILKEVFDMFSDVDGGFTKTNIPIKNVFETSPVSRSQAKRLCNRFDKFKEVELDFEGVQEIGQGFAHELFVVFQNNHPEVVLLPLNVSPDVQKMIQHVKKTNI